MLLYLLVKVHSLIDKLDLLYANIILSSITIILSIENPQCRALSSTLEAQLSGPHLVRFDYPNHENDCSNRVVTVLLGLLKFLIF